MLLSEDRLLGETMMHSVPNCLTASQSFETSYFAPPSPLESSPPSSPFDFDLDLLPDEIVSPSNLDFSLTTPLHSSLQIEIELSVNKKNTSNAASKSYLPLTNTFSPDCQVPDSPSNLSIDSGILSPMMFSPSSEEQANNPSDDCSYSNTTGSVCGNLQGHHAQQQRNVPSASPMSLSPLSPAYSPGARQQRRLSSTDSGKTSTSTGSVRSCGGLNIFGRNDSCINQSAVNLQESLNDFAQLQEKIRLEQEGLSSPENRFQTTISTGLTIGRLPTTITQSSFNTNSQVTNVLSSLAHYPHDILSSSEGGGKVPSSLSLRSKLHATIKTEPTFELSDSTSPNTGVYSTKPTPLLRQVLEDKSFEQYGLKPLDFVIEPNSLGRMNKSLAEPQAMSVYEQPEAFVKQDVAGISNNPVISLAMDQVKKDILTTCEILSISPDPSCWSKSDIKSWMTWTQQQYNIPPFDYGLWAAYSGAGFVRLTEDDFKQRIPQGGDRVYAQLDLWRSAALASSALPVLSSDINVLSENKKKQQEAQAHRGLNISPISVSHGVTMSRNTSQHINSLVQRPPPLSILQSPPPYQLNRPSISYKPSSLDFEPIMEQNHPNKDSSLGSLLGSQLPDISTFQSPVLKSEKYDLIDVLNMLDTGNSMEHNKEIKKEHHNSGPPQYPVFSQTPTSIYDSVVISTTSNSPSLGTQPFMSSYQSQATRSPTQLVWSSSGLTNTTGGNLLITPSSLPSLQIINTSATVSSPQQESIQLKQEHPVISTHQLNQLLPPPYPGTVSKTTMDLQSSNQQSLQQLQKAYIGHNPTELTRHSVEEQELEDEDMKERIPTTQARSLTPAVTISPVRNTVVVPHTHPITGRTTTNIHLWQFIKELLLHPELHSSSIHWVDRETGIFKIVDSVRVATLWGKRKNRPAMNYDKLSRSLRQYYKKGIMKKTERTQRLVYQFCHPYHL